VRLPFIPPADDHIGKISFRFRGRRDPDPMLKPSHSLDTAEVAVALPGASLFREGMSRVAGAVHVVTTDGPAGRAGFTATAVAPVTDSPASLVVCVNAAGRSATFLEANGVFCVNTLRGDDAPVAEAFAGRADLHGQDRFTVGRWVPLATGSPLLATCLVAFDCRVTDARLVGTHHVVIGEIAAIHLGASGPGLVYQGRAYHRLD
jgi:flavin reductase (DIM6/NTAB) family NADH-FMN oxidoreductase RutF